MTKEQILEFNKKCAQFIGAKHYNDDPEIFPEGYWLLDDLPYYLTQMEFHFDWDWIMEIKKAIIANGFVFKVTEDYITIKIADQVGIVVVCVEFNRDEKSAMVTAIDKFFTWYYSPSLEK